VERNYQPPPPVMKRRMKRSCSEWQLTFSSLSMDISDEKVVRLDNSEILAIDGSPRQRKSIRRFSEFLAAPAAILAGLLLSANHQRQS
jgi:hypothetical protein